MSVITRRPWLTRGQITNFQIVGLGSISHGKYTTNIQFLLHFYRVKKNIISVFVKSAEELVFFLVTKNYEE